MKIGDVFAVQLSNGNFSIGQILDFRWKNCVRCALFDEVLSNIQLKNVNELCKNEDLISLIECTIEQLYYDVWKIVGNKQILIPQEKYPNEQYKNNKWIGSKTYDAALIEDFLNAYNALQPWDDWADPNYFDKFLVIMSKKPDNLILIKT